MQKNYFFLLAIVSVLFFSCSKKENEELSENLTLNYSFGYNENKLPLFGPIHMTKDSSYVYISDTGYSSIFKYTYEGEYVQNFGKPGKPGPGPGEMANQTVIDVGDDWLYVQDVSNRRFIQFSLKQDSSVIITKRNLLFTEFDYHNGYFYSFNPIHLSEPISSDSSDLIEIYDHELNFISSFGTYLNFADDMLKGQSLYDMEISDNHLFILFRYFPLLRVYNLKGNLVSEYDIGDPTQSARVINNIDVNNNKFGTDFTFTYVNRGMTINGDRLFIARQERHILIDEYKLKGLDLEYITTHKKVNNLPEDYFIIDFFFDQERNSFFILENNETMRISVYDLNSPLKNESK